MPLLSLLNEDGEELPVHLEDIEENEVFQDAPIISPLTPKLTPTIRAQNLSPFWLSGANNLPLPQISGSTGDSPLDPLRSPGAGVGFSMLHAAAITGDCSGLEKLASGNFCDIDLRDKFGRTPLMYAILGNYPACVDILLQNGSNATLVDSSGRNSLHWAVHHDNFDCVRSILSKVKLDWKTPDQGGVTILHLAAREG
ncbi:inversin-B isoform X2 [Eurytemora carolleeae]|nr:inversin-B isoform X2 [Eurytemora carolleeae]|eukprot:XP_023320780.1 inversin-B-like isoform X2 [Eurytemora affinis]